MLHPSISRCIHPPPSTAGGQVPAVKAYDAYLKQAVYPCADACDALGLPDASASLRTIFEGLRTVILLASRSKLPEDDLAAALSPHLPHTAVQTLATQSSKQWSRDWDWHAKALQEVIGPCVSWVMFRAPAQLPVGLVKEAWSSAEFWTNRIRKQHNSGAAAQQHLAFCDSLKKVVLDLVAYIDANHKTGLTFNPKGVSLAEAAIVLTDESDGAAAGATGGADAAPPSPKRQHPTLGNVVGSGNMAGLMGELNKRKTADGSSAATGLKHVRT